MPPTFAVRLGDAAVRATRSPLRAKDRKNRPRYQLTVLLADDLQAGSARAGAVFCSAGAGSRRRPVANHRSVY